MENEEKLRRHYCLTFIVPENHPHENPAKLPIINRPNGLYDGFPS
jgi:hypothetical protein